MEAFIKHRIADRRFSDTRPIQMGQASSWVALSDRPNLSIHRVNASMENKAYDSNKEKSGEKEKKKEKKKRARSDGGSVTSDGTDNGSCWSNFKRKRGTKKYAKGSCEPKSGKD